jgi:hypothetical protein
MERNNHENTEFGKHENYLSGPSAKIRQIPFYRPLSIPTTGGEKLDPPLDGGGWEADHKIKRNSK